MRKQIAVALAVLISTTLFCIAQALPSAIADIPFSFLAEGKTLPAGTYSFTEGDTPNLMVIHNTKGNPSVIATVITRLGTRAEKEAEIVFDVTGNDHYLSEVHIPDTDGYLLKATTVKHTHTIIKGKK